MCSSYCLARRPLDIITHNMDDPWATFRRAQTAAISSKLISDSVRQAPDEYVYFGSGQKMPHALLSNFSHCNFEFRGATFESAEHAFQAHLRLKDPTGFASPGRFDFPHGLGEVFLACDVTKKAKHYGTNSSGRRQMTGIIPKMAVKDVVANRLGLELRCDDAHQDRLDNKGVLIPLFLDILKAKYDADEDCRSALLSTGSMTLVEFSRQAACRHNRGSVELWTGQVVREKNALYGMNRQGELQMAMRTWYNYGLTQVSQETDDAAAAKRPRLLRSERGGASEAA